MVNRRLMKKLAKDFYSKVETALIDSIVDWLEENVDEISDENMGLFSLEVIKHFWSIVRKIVPEILEEKEAELLPKKKKEK